MWYCIFNQNDSCITDHVITYKYYIFYLDSKETGKNREGNNYPGPYIIPFNLNYAYIGIGLVKKSSFLLSITPSCPYFSSLKTKALIENVMFQILFKYSKVHYPRKNRWSRNRTSVCCHRKSSQEPKDQVCPRIQDHVIVRAYTTAASHC